MHSRHTILIISLLLIVNNALAQQIITGKVLNKYGTMPGVTASVPGTSYGIVTDTNGRFSISGTFNGTFKVRFTYPGYDTSEKSVAIEHGNNADMGSIMLVENATQMKEVVVKGKMVQGSTAAAVSLTRNSTKVETVLSQEGIQKLPDKNVAEAVQRVAGAKMERNKGEGSNVSLRGTPGDWTATLVNGDRLPTVDEDNPSRTFEFEVFPSNMVDYIFVTRTVTPDIEGDNIGGAINFQTISPPDKRVLKINVGAGENLIAGKPLYDLNFVYGDVTKNKKLSFTIAASDYTRPYGADAFQLVYGSPFSHGINKVELKDYFGERTTIGVNAAVQYKPNDRLKIGAHFMHGRMDDNKYQYKLDYNYSDGSGQRIHMLSTHGLLERRLYGGDVTGEYKVSDKFTLDAKVASYQNLFQYGNFPYGKNDPRNGYVTYDFISNNLLQFKDMVNTDFFGHIPTPPDQGGPVKLIGKDDPYGTGVGYNNINPQPDIPVTAKDFHFYQVYSIYNRTLEQDPVVAQLNGTYVLNSKVKLKAGVKVRTKEGSRDISEYQWLQQLSNPAIPTDPLYIDHFQLQNPPRNSTFLSEMGNAYENKMIAFLTPSQMSSFITQLGDTLRPVPMNKYNPDNRLWEGGHYSYTETVLAGYMMAEVELGTKWKLTGGLRVEETILHESGDTLDVSALLSYTDPLGNYYNYFEPKKQTVDRRYIAVLPSLNAEYHINENSDLRLAASRTFHRPNFEETKPGSPIYYEDRQELYIGNPSLRPTYSSNFDATYQLYFGRKDLVTFGVYYKNITDHILLFTTGQDDAASLLISRYGNADKAYVLGTEASIDKHFDFLSGFWSGFGINANITYSYSQMRIPQRPDPLAMTEQTPLVYNIGLYYEKGRINTKIALNYTGPYLMVLNLANLPGVGYVHKDSDYDQFRAEMYSLDYQLTVKINKHFSAYGEANNLLDAPYKIYIGQEWRPKRIEYYHQRVQLGLKFEL